MAQHEKMASWDRHRTKQELRNFIDARISAFDDFEELDLY
jgi:hypothetical protein